MKRRILSSLMALVLCLTLLPAAAYAAGQEDAKAASRVAENASSAADSRENP